MEPLRKKILIVEDDLHISKIYEVAFLNEGCDVAFAVNVDEAMRITTSDRPDLIILDLMLPQMDGFVFLEEVKNDPVHKEIPVIVMSNLGHRLDMTRALGLGANEYIVKVDVSLADMLVCVKRYL